MAAPLSALSRILFLSPDQEDWVLAWKVEKPLIDKSKEKGTDVYYTLLGELRSHVDNCFRLTAGR
jgi:hypothetical protein